MENIALSTSFSAKHNWDPIYSIELTKKYNLNTCQIYIGDNFKDKFLVDSINIINDVNYTFHSNYNLDLNGIQNEEIKIIKSINSRDKLVVFHHTINSPIENCLEALQELNSRGITVLLENFYEDYSRIEDSVNSFINLIKMAKESKLKLFPLIDFPRLFIDKAQEKIDPIKLTFKLLREVSALDYPLYTHLIDSKNSNQKRDYWCAIGKGEIPYNQIFKYIKKLNIEIPLHILELEDEKHILESIDYLSKS